MRSKSKLDHIIDNILNGTLKREECDHEYVHEFLKLLKKNQENTTEEAIVWKKLKQKNGLKW